MTSGKRFLSIDVECVATGIRHDAREVCYVSVVDADEKILLSKKVKPEKPVVSYLTPLTGIRKGDLDNGEKSLLKSNPFLVLTWCLLVRGSSLTLTGSSSNREQILLSLWRCLRLITGAMGILAISL